MPLHKQIAQENINRLGVPTGIEGSSFALTKLTARRSEPGYLVSETSFSEWRFLGLARSDGETSVSRAKESFSPTAALFSFSRQG